MNKRVLLIDDDKELCDELCEILREEGFNAEYALTPGKGKEMLFKNVYDILLLDFRMPQESGIDLLKEIKGKIRADLRIYLVSGSITIKKLLAEQKLSTLVSGVFGKPFDIEALLKELRR